MDMHKLIDRDILILMPKVIGDKTHAPALSFSKYRVRFTGMRGFLVQGKELMMTTFRVRVRVVAWAYIFNIWESLPEHVVGASHVVELSDHKFIKNQYQRKIVRSALAFRGEEKQCGHESRKRE